MALYAHVARLQERHGLGQHGKQRGRGSAGGGAADLLSGDDEFLLAADPEAELLDPSSDLRIHELFRRQHALVKTVKNHDWLLLVSNLVDSGDKEFRTSFSLPPTTGCDMNLFGNVAKGCAGFVVDRNALDLQTAFIWPSGYSAKTEHNLEEGNLLRGRSERLCDFADLEEANRTLTYTEPYTGKLRGPPLPYNEINVLVKGVEAIVAVFARSRTFKHLLFALSVRSLLEHSFPLLQGKLFVFVMDETNPIRVLSRAEEADLICQYVKRCSPCPSAVLVPRLPVAVGAELSEHLDLRIRLLFHCQYGLTHSSLLELMRALEQKPITEVYAMIGLGLSTAVAAENVPSLRELVRAAAPLLFSASLHGPAGFTPPSTVSTACSSADGASHEGEATVGLYRAGGAEKAALLGPSPLAGRKLRGSSNLLAALAVQADHVRVTETGYSSLSGAVGHVWELCRVNLGTPTRVALGAHIVLGEYALGYSSQRLQSAIDEVSAWLREVEQTPGCGILRRTRRVRFLVKSWRETQKVEPASRLCSFLTGRATENRRHFRDALLSLECSDDGLAYFRKMFWLINSFRQTCLRFRIARKILGLDETFDRDAVFGVVCFALDIVDRMSSGTALDVVDESTRLEAQAVAFGAARPIFKRQSKNVAFGSDVSGSTTSSFNSDPVGARQRHLRAIYRSRANTL